MWSASIKESIKIMAITILTLILGLIAQIVVSTGGDFSSIVGILSDTSNLMSVMGKVFRFTIGQLSIFIVLLIMFAFSVSLLNSIANILGATPTPSPPKPKKEKKKKEKKPKKEEKPVAPQPVEQIADTGNYCKICNKPISPGRAICPQCEQILKGEVPPSQMQSGQSGSG